MRLVNTSPPAQKQLTDLDIPMSLEVKHCKATYIPEPINMHREFTEEVDNSRRTRGKGVPQYERRQNHRKKLSNEDHDLHREQLPELFVDL